MAARRRKSFENGQGAHELLAGEEAVGHELAGAEGDRRRGLGVRHGWSWPRRPRERRGEEEEERGRGLAGGTKTLGEGAAIAYIRWACSWRRRSFEI